MTRLKAAAWFYAIGTLLHTLDHFRRGTDAVSEPVVFLGTFGMVFAAVAITLALTEHPAAARAAVIVGFPHAFGIAAVHYLPHWSLLSDSAVGASWSVVSWLAVSLEVFGALAFAITGAAMLRRLSWVGDPAPANIR